jgi:hypothetical protein
MIGFYEISGISEHEWQSLPAPKNGVGIVIVPRMRCFGPGAGCNPSCEVESAIPRASAASLRLRLALTVAAKEQSSG